ncbi:MAG TPA: universal stress protein [Polyangiaceae bacterium]|nr:universal stress protein [Polyangiaceae bacterium]
MTTSEDAPLQNTDEPVSVIVVAVDASAQAAHVVSTAARLGRISPDATLHVVHVFRVGRLDRARVGAPQPSADAMAEAREYLDAHARAARRQCRNAVVSHLPVGDPTEEILRLCDELDAGLMIIGTHDYAGFERFLLGSIAETIVRKAHCSVLVVRRPADRAARRPAG